jgi:hypothetical protein
LVSTVTALRFKGDVDQQETIRIYKVNIRSDKTHIEAIFVINRTPAVTAHGSDTYHHDGVHAGLPRPGGPDRYHLVAGGDLADVLAAADLVISRTAVRNLPSSSLPSRLGTDEQRCNAHHLADAEPAVCLASPDAAPSRLLAELHQELDGRARMAANAAALGRPDAT